jgi:hypothetical protein
MTSVTQNKSRQKISVAHHFARTLPLPFKYTEENNNKKITPTNKANPLLGYIHISFFYDGI